MPRLAFVPIAFARGDPCETSDAVFGVKESLVVDLGNVDEATAKQYGVSEGSALLVYDFVLVTEADTSKLRDQNSAAALQRLGKKVRLVDGLPVPDVD